MKYITINELDQALDKQTKALSVMIDHKFEVNLAPIKQELAEHKQILNKHSVAIDFIIKDHAELIEFLGEKFERIDQRFIQIDQRFEQIDQKFFQIDQKFEGKFAQLPTKDYLDDKIGGLEGRLMVHFRKGDKKVNRLAEMLKHKRILSNQETSELKRIQNFAV